MVERRISARPGQKTFRADPALLDELERRAMAETVALGVDVGASDLIRRGIEWVLAQPMPGAKRRECNVVTTCGFGTRCLTCKTYGTADGVECPRDGEVVRG